MNPIEILFITIGFIVALIGITRGHVKESGVTMVLFAAIFLLTYLEPRILRVLARVIGPWSETDRLNPNNLFYFLLFAVVFGSLVYASYAGRVVNLNPNQVAGPQGTTFDIVLGVINGYLVAGMLWYYLDKFKYPLISIEPTLSDEAQAFVEFLPPTLFPSPFFWVVPIALLLVLRVIG